MSKNILLLKLLILLSIFSVKSQNSNLVIGIKAGTNYSTYTPKYLISGRKDVRYSGKFGFYLGGFLNIKITDDLKFQTELIFGLQGSRFLNENIVFEEDIDNIHILDFEFHIHEHTIILPLIVQYSLVEKLYIEGGLQFGYIINRSEKIKKDPFKELTGTNTQPSEIDYDKFDMGITFGMGYQLSDRFGINSRYFFGLIERNNTIKSSVFNLGIEYKL